MKQRVLSGMRPTGRLHLGHWVGALANWAEIQKEQDCFFMVADWHALMSEYEHPDEIRTYARECVADWVACGIDPERACIFLQSQVKEHLELAMVLSTLTPLSWLERNPTYKEQLRELSSRELTTYGFLGYPVLQAADILLYKATRVPIGVDQLPHLELAREIARRFNHLYRREVFPDPEALMTQVPKLSGIDGRKMSKSYDNSINLSDAPETIRAKAQKMFTDPKRIKMTDPGHPEECNVCNYYKIFAPERAPEIFEKCREASWGCTDCKRELAERLIERLKPVQAKRQDLLSNARGIDQILEAGAARARAVAQETMGEVRELVGLVAE